MADRPLIDWESGESHLILNPRLPETDRLTLESWVAGRLQSFPRHLFLTTSGTTGSLKLVALSKDAMLASAAAVNRRLEASARDVWRRVLPHWHVGGLGIEARAFLSGASVEMTSWDPDAFAADTKVTLSALVPAQVSDLVERGLEAPRQLRAVVVGGGALRPDLYERALASGWPLLPSYGATETCSQVATAYPGSPVLRLLDHVESRVEKDGRLAFRGPSLLSAYATGEGISDPKSADGWFVTEDLGSIDGEVLHVTGRRGGWVKIGGESVDLARLDAILEKIAGRRAAIVAVPDVRLENVIWLAVEEGADADAIAAAFTDRVLPFERPRAVFTIPRIPRSDLGKLLRTKLREILLQTLE